MEATNDHDPHPIRVAIRAAEEKEGEMSDRAAPTGTYKEHVGPFDAIENLAGEARERGQKLLRTAGWTYTSETPGCRWMWEKAMPDGRILLVSQDTALAFARAEACARVNPAEFGD